MSHDYTKYELTNQPELSAELEQIISDALRPHLMQTFGYHALLYSPQAKLLCSDALRIKNQVIIAPQGKGLSARCRFEELPIASDSIDLAVLPNILQHSGNPHQILREVERVLIPEGVVILVGRNPYSWKGVQQKLKQFGRKPSPKSESVAPERDLSRNRILDWARLLGLEVEKEINTGVTNNRLQTSASFGWIKQAGQVFCDYFCSYYIIIARKKVSTLTPIRASWRRNKHLVPPRLAEPSVKAQVESWIKQLK